MSNTPPLTRPEFFDCVGNELKFGDYVVYNGGTLFIAKIAEVAWQAQGGYDYSSGMGNYVRNLKYIPKIKVVAIKREYNKNNWTLLSKAKGHTWDAKIMKIDPRMLPTLVFDTLNIGFDAYIKKYPYLAK